MHQSSQRIKHIFTLLNTVSCIRSELNYRVMSSRFVELEGRLEVAELSEEDIRRAKDSLFGEA